MELLILISLVTVLTTSTSLALADTGPPCGRCVGRNTTVASRDDNCHCDDMCDLYDDCCSDGPKSDKTLDPATVTCRTHPEYIASDSGSLHSIYSVERCPAGYHDDMTRELCEDTDTDDDIFLKVPVTGRRSRVLYKNMYCAVCNEVSSFEGPADVLFWNVRKECINGWGQPVDSENEIEEVFNGNNDTCTVKYKFIPPTARLFEGQLPYRHCTKSIDQCSLDWATNDENKMAVSALCQNHTDYVYTQRITFRNAFCAQCNGELYVTCVRQSGGVDEFVIVPPYSVLMDVNMGVTKMFNKNQALTERQETPVSCPLGQVYDMFGEKCRVLSRSTRAVQSLPQQPTGTTNVTRNMSMCDLIEYMTGEFDSLANGSVFVPALETVLYVGEFILRNSNLVTCRPTSMYENYTATNVSIEPYTGIDMMIQSYITLIGLILSLVCLAACIIAHIMFPALRNVPGKCVVGLSGSLFVAQILFITTITMTDNPACYFFGLLMHYSFLASFCWTNCLAFDICRAFSRTQTDEGAHTKRYIRYSCYAWFTPLIAVLLGVILDNTAGVEVEFRPRYGDPFCWINGGKALLLTFVLPIALIIVSNFVMFSLTVRSIWLSKKSARNVLKRKENGRVMDLVLYVKLSIIMGLTWVFGPLAAATGSNVLWYFFIVFNSLQGVLLFISFVLTNKVKKLARDHRSTLMTSSIFRSMKTTRTSTSSAAIYTKESAKSDLQVTSVTVNSARDDIYSNDSIHVDTHV